MVNIQSFCVINIHMQNKKHTLQDLVDVMRDLRTPETGCPWDLEQDFKSIAPYTLEEAYEVADAIDRYDMSDLREELGDLLFQSVYHAQMASEAGAFDLHDVVHDITAKMISRHPHVFGDEKANTASDVDQIWDVQKNKEKSGSDNSALSGITRHLPSLLKAQKLQKKSSKAGFVWKNPLSILDKLEEEIAEMRMAIENEDKENQSEELGDIIFLLANYGRELGLNAEEALRQCNNKFERRFRGLEEDLRSQGVELKDASLEQMSDAWDEQKRLEKPA